MATFVVASDSQTWQAGPQDVTKYDKVRFNASGTVEWQPGDYAEVEGAYPAYGYPNGWPLNIGDCPSNSGGIAVVILSGLQVRALSLVIRPVAAGVNPGTPTVGSGVLAVEPRWYMSEDGLTREWYLYPSEMAAASGDEEGPWDIYFCFNDSVWVDNVGDYTVETDVINIGNQGSFFMGRGGDLTDEDRETASVCTKTGILTPGNRLVEVSERLVVERVAAWSKRDFYVYED